MSSSQHTTQDGREPEPPPPPPTQRTLVKGALKPPPVKHAGSLKSYTLPLKTNEEVTVRKAADRSKRAEPVEVSSTAVAQPFVDPAVLERRGRR